MKNFAFVLLSDTVFGGAQRRFINLFLYLKKINPENGVFIMTPAMKSEMAEFYGVESTKDVLTVGNIEKASRNTEARHNQTEPSRHHKPKSLLRNNLLYKLYYFYKTKSAQESLFHEIESLQKKYQIDSFLAIYTGVFPLYFYLKSKKDRPKIVFVNMDSWFSHLSVNPKKDWYKKYDLFNFAHEQSDAIDLLSPFILEGLQSRQIILKKDAYSITPCSFTDYSRCEVGEKKNADILFASRLEADKNPMMFLEAAAKIAPSFPQTRFIIAGEGRQGSMIRQRISELGISNIIFKGFVAHLPNLMSSTSIFISLQKENNYPSQAVLEAMACGNAIIATDVGDTRLFINAQNGWLVKTEIEDLANMMRHCLENPEETEQKGKFASRYVRENFSIERAASYYMNLLKHRN